MNEKTFIQAGSLAAIIGVILLLIFTFLHPLKADPGDAEAAFLEYAADPYWVTIHLGQFFGVLLMVGALVALYDTLAKERAGWLARFGVVTAVVSLAATAVLQAIDGVALKAMVDNWADATPDHKPATFQAAFAVRQIEVGMASLMAILFGITMLLYGFAIAASRIYPRWLGWVAVCAGAGTIAGGWITAHTGFSLRTMTIAAPFNLLMVVWMVVMGVLMWRRASLSE
ncbi:MAG: DUF4386 family protein [Acidiferrobacterales bacterium]